MQKTRIPVYNDSTGVPNIYIWEETPDGYFRRTGEQPLGALRGGIEDIGPQVGELLSHRSDRERRRWDTPTVRYHLGHPQSWYQFIRDRLKERRIVVVTTPVMLARVLKFDVHEINFKRSASLSTIRIMINRYAEALDIWLKE